MHRDLKPSNVLITPECIVKICDFGLARTIESEKPETRRPNSPSCFRDTCCPPEAVNCSSNYTEAVDMWAFGVIVNMFELRMAAQQSHQHLNSVDSPSSSALGGTFSASDRLKSDGDQSKLPIEIIEEHN